ncbi:MAG TPA: FliH/SctL family protein [Ignavibacteriaceae bacterium]|nr:FliH/SctL family protein [Ignavibacteriaceae bacterium]
MSDPLKINIKQSKLNLKVNGRVYSEEEALLENLDPYQKKMENEFESGYKEGYKKAVENLEQTYRERLEKKFNEIHEIISLLNEKIDLYDREFERVALKLSLMLCEKMLLREVVLSSPVTASLNEALRKVIGANNILVKLNSSDYELISRESNKLIHTDSFSKIKFETDERIEKGGCIVETEIGNVDATIGSQLNEIKKQFDSILNPAV